MLACVWNVKEKNLFRAGMNKRFKREYFVEKSSDAMVNKRSWITVKGKYYYYNIIFIIFYYIIIFIFFLLFYFPLRENIIFLSEL